MKIVENGTSCPALPVESNRAASEEIKLSRPVNIFPSPMAINPKMGIKIPPTIRPMALILSETATALSPPKTA